MKSKFFTLALLGAGFVLFAGNSNAQAFELLDRVLGIGHHNGCGSCCEPSCCEPTCCEPVCCEPVCCEPEPSCCAPEPSCCDPCDSCCNSGRRWRPFAKLKALFSCHKRSCCEPSCCEPVCCEPEPTCCCN